MFPFNRSLPSHDLAKEADALNYCGAIDMDEHASQAWHRFRSTCSEVVDDLLNERNAIRRSEENIEEVLSF